MSYRILGRVAFIESSDWVRRSDLSDQRVSDRHSAQNDADGPVRQFLLLLAIDFSVGCVKRSETHHRTFPVVRSALLHAPYESALKTDWNPGQILTC